MDFKNVIIGNISNFTVMDLIDIKTAIDNYLGGDDLQIQTARIMSESGKLSAVKYVKDKTGWGLRESKEYCDKLG